AEHAHIDRSHLLTNDQDSRAWQLQLLVEARQFAVEVPERNGHPRREHGDGSGDLSGRAPVHGVDHLHHGVTRLIYSGEKRVHVNYLPWCALQLLLGLAPMLRRAASLDRAAYPETLPAWFVRVRRGTALARWDTRVSSQVPAWPWRSMPSGTALLLSRRHPRPGA